MCCEWLLITLKNIWSKPTGVTAENKQAFFFNRHELGIHFCSTAILILMKKTQTDVFVYHIGNLCEIGTHETPLQVIWKMQQTS